jgi:hypothetical protein
MQICAGSTFGGTPARGTQSWHLLAAITCSSFISLLSCEAKGKLRLGRCRGAKGLCVYTYAPTVAPPACLPQMGFNNARS